MIGPASMAGGNGKSTAGLKIRRVALDTLHADPANARTHDQRNLDAIQSSIAHFGQVEPLVVQKGTGRVIGGNGRLAVLQQLGRKSTDVVEIEVDDVNATALGIALNRTAELAAWDDDALAKHLATLQSMDGFDEGLTGFDGDEIQKQIDAAFEPGTKPAISLAERFGVPPFSVLDARQGYWQERKKAWLSLGLRSGDGRAAPSMSPGGNAEERRLTFVTGNRKHSDLDEVSKKILEPGGASIFDPVLCELAYRWFSPEGGIVLDPFAGGSVRGIVAERVGREYVGIDLRPEQVEANEQQAKEICDKSPRWVVGDSRDIKTLAVGEYDFLFSCPPYGDLEQYSEDERDLSSLDYPLFIESYREIIAASCAMLRQDRFACFVVGEIRDKAGSYRDFVGDTVQAFRDAGLEYYNEAILVTAAGSLPIRAGKQFSSSRKLGKTHQNVLVFVKGSAKKATAAIGECAFGWAGEENGGEQP